MNIIYKAFLKRYIISTNIPIRFLRNYARKDPGISKRGALLDGDLSIDEDLDDLESEFFELGKSHKQHNVEVKASKELRKYHIVRQKYFKESYPNFLTWADKQQIKYLHQTDGEEWTIERLSEGFPALPETIQKIIKNNWVPKNENRVKKHDAAVQENWKNFKTQHLTNLPSHLCDHLNKFTSRELNLNQNLEELNIQDVRKHELVKKGGEFSSIIESYEALKSKTKKSNINEHSKQLSDGKLHSVSIESDLLKKKHTNLSHSMLTYSELQKKIGHNSSSQVIQTNTNVSVSLINDDVNLKEITLQSKDLDSNLTKFKSADSSVNMYKPKHDYSNLMYPERIRIPADKHRNGYTYKLNDCFYDSDGEFLYRVPGMH